jgi:hypothetical protein
MLKFDRLMMILSVFCPQSGRTKRSASSKLPMLLLQLLALRGNTGYVWFTPDRSWVSEVSIASSTPHVRTGNSVNPPRTKGCCLSLGANSNSRRSKWPCVTRSSGWSSIMTPMRGLDGQIRVQTAPMAFKMAERTDVRGNHWMVPRWCDPARGSAEPRLTGGD